MPFSRPYSCIHTHTKVFFHEKWTYQLSTRSSIPIIYHKEPFNKLSVDIITHLSLYSIYLTSFCWLEKSSFIFRYIISFFFSVLNFWPKKQNENKCSTFYWYKSVGNRLSRDKCMSYTFVKELFFSPLLFSYGSKNCI